MNNWGRTWFHVERISARKVSCARESILIFCLELLCGRERGFQLSFDAVVQLDKSKFDAEMWTKYHMCVGDVEIACCGLVLIAA